MSENPNNDPEMLDEYDFTRGVRGKYGNRTAASRKTIALEDDVDENLSNFESSDEVALVLDPSTAK